MFTGPAPAAPTISTTTSSASPAAPSRGGRLRGLSYLRSYTQSHLNNQTTPRTRSASPPHPIASGQSLPTPSAESTRATGRASDRTAPRPRRSNTDISSIQSSAASGSTGGWLPTVGGRSGLSRVSTRQQSPATVAPSAEPLSSNLPASRRSLDSTSRTSGSRSERASQAGSRITLLPPLPPNMPGAPLSAGLVLDGPSGNRDDGRSGAMQTQMPSIRFIPYQDPRSARPSLVFPAVTRTLPSSDCVIRVGRYSERDNNPDAASNAPSAAPVGFKSKVVSRRHCEFWCSNSQWYIKDVKSSSGTFLNHIRLSQPGVESRPWPVNDGDVIQLGIDFRGGEEMIFRCVKIRLECNRGWQKNLNPFNKSTHKRLQNLAKSAAKKNGDTASMHTSECSICLMSVAPCQSLFVAPCSHVWHYKCIRPILTWPNFLCPNCRAVADLEADVDAPYDVDWEDEKSQHDDPADGVNTSAGAPHGVRTPTDQSDHSGVFDTNLDVDLTTSITNVPTINSGSASTVPRPPRIDDRTASTSASVVLPRSIAESRDSHTAPPRLQSRISNDNPPVLPSPVSAEPFSLFAETIGPEGPMTPRNDAGPFVLDGSVGRSQGRRLLQNIDQATDTPQADAHDDP